tara:strand:- start:574 stop:1269 length:696 start_codon:yes stop_codon:yes gene_type:complete
MIDTSSPLSNHLEDLRTYLMWPLTITFILILILVNYSDNIISELLTISSLELSNLTTYTPTEMIKMKIYVSLVGSAILCSPIWFRGFYKFSRPGLTDKEANGLAIIFSLGMVLFLVGFILGTYHVAPSVINLFIENSNIVEAKLSVYETMKLLISISIFCGFLVSLPILTLISTDYKNNVEDVRKYMYLVILIMVTVATPQPSLIVNLCFMILFAGIIEISLLISGGKSGS